MSGALRCISQAPFSVGASPVLATTKQLGPLCTSVRNKNYGVRNYWKIPKENKRRNQSYEARLKTRGGRMILMRKILKGKAQLAH